MLQKFLFVSRFPGLIVLGMTLLAGCDSTPTNAGADLIDRQSGGPILVTIATAVFESQTDPDITGGSGTVGANRALAGIVNDPALGMIEAKGHIDFAPVSSTSDAFKNGSISLAELTLDLDYVYGDTINPLTLQIVDIIDDWDPLGVSADTTLMTGNPVMELEISPHAQILRIELPEDWIERNDTVLRSSNFQDEFHGFLFRAISGNTVVGFHHQASTLKLAVPGDTAFFALSKVLSVIDKSRTSPPEGNLLIQDGTDSRIRVDFDLGVESVAGSLIHRAVLRITSDSPALDTPPGYVRPGITKLNLAFVSGVPKVRILVASADIGADGLISFENVLFNNILKSVLLGSLEEASFEISVPISESTLDILFVENSLSRSPPSAVLTITNIN